MANRSDFSRNLAQLDLSHLNRAVAFLYYYRETQEFEERSASDLAADLQEGGFVSGWPLRVRRQAMAGRAIRRATRTQAPRALVDRDAKRRQQAL